MGQSWTHLQGKPVIDWDRDSASVTVPSTSAVTVVVDIQAKMGKKPYIVAVKQAWASAMDNVVRWAVRVNGEIHPRFPFTLVQLAPPESDYKLPVREEIGQGSLVEIVAYSTTAGTVTGVIELEYEEF